MTDLWIAGIDGRMGRACAALAAQYGFTARPFSPEAAEGIALDFSHPDALAGILATVLSRRLPLVEGVTGHTEAQRAALRRAAGVVPLFQSANFSLGVYALARLSRQARAMLGDWDCSLLERHHRQKLDAPSGTARALCAELVLPPDGALSIRGGTVCGEHEVTFYGPQEELTLLHRAQSRDVFAHGALRAAAWLLRQEPGDYGMDDLMAFVMGKK